MSTPILPQIPGSNHEANASGVSQEESAAPSLSSKEGEEKTDFATAKGRDTLGMQSEETGLVLSALQDAACAIATLDEGALGFGQNHEYRWPLRNELLSKLKRAISQQKSSL